MRFTQYVNLQIRRYALHPTKLSIFFDALPWMCVSIFSAGQIRPGQASAVIWSLNRHSWDPWKAPVACLMAVRWQRNNEHCGLCQPPSHQRSTSPCRISTTWRTQQANNTRKQLLPGLKETQPTSPRLVQSWMHFHPSHRILHWEILSLASRARRHQRARVCICWERNHQENGWSACVLLLNEEKRESQDPRKLDCYSSCPWQNHRS